MLRFTSLKDAFHVCSAIGSPIRLEILEQLLNEPQNMDSLAKRLHLTGGALTRHVKILEDAGLIMVKTLPCNRGYQKLCSVNFDKLIIELPTGGALESASIADVPIGLFSDYRVQGKCGIVSKEGFIGSRDNAGAFLSSSRASAGAIWLERGYLSYLLPQLESNKGALQSDKTLDELRISLEISPDFVGGEAIKRGTVSFYLDDELLSEIWLNTPSENRRGYLTPDWHESALPQYGTLKLIRICDGGTYLDGDKISNVTIAAAKKAKKFSLLSDSGFMLFGHGFGDYGQGIKFF